MDRIPFLATEAARGYEAGVRLPVSVLLDNVRSLYNVGAFFRTADGAAVEKLYLCGITGRPPKAGIAKTALGAQEVVAWEHHPDALEALARLRESGYELVTVDTSLRAVDLFDWRPRFPVCVIFGHEVEGVRPEVAERCDTHVRVPMLGRKHSLNVATCGGVVVYELLRQWRSLMRGPAPGAAMPGANASGDRGRGAGESAAAAGELALFHPLHALQNLASLGFPLARHANAPPPDRIPALLARHYVLVHREKGYSGFLQ
jgi:tRNA(Leu) C34 or U34 (ribose-2'-O)-methylase TrmL